MPCEFVIHGLSKWIWSTYIQGKIKKEAAIACAVSAIRVCALITHHQPILTLLRECNGPQITNWKLYKTETSPKKCTMLIVLLWSLVSRWRVELNGWYKFYFGTIWFWSFFVNKLSFSQFRVCSEEAQTSNFWRIVSDLASTRWVKKWAWYANYVYFCSHWDVDTFCHWNKWKIRGAHNYGKWIFTGQTILLLFDGEVDHHHPHIPHHDQHLQCQHPGEG